MTSDCVQVQNRSGQDCLQNHMNELSDECQNIYKSYVHCKRGMLDMRKRCGVARIGVILSALVLTIRACPHNRFRGNAPPSAKSNNQPGGTSQVDMQPEEALAR